MPYKHLALRLGPAVNSEARVYFEAYRDADILSIAGRVHGPHCDWARTLPAEYALQQISASAGAGCLAQLLLPDPCYWTPQLPFQYELQLSLQFEPGHSREMTTTLGLRRWGCDGRNLLLDRRRIVLRGCASASPLTQETLAEARHAEATLLVESPSAQQCATASQLGVPLIVDLRQAGQEFPVLWQRLAWSAAALIVVVTGEQLQSDLARCPARAQALAAQTITSKTTCEDAASVACDLYAIDLQPGERPPAWLADCEIPVIGIRTEEIDLEWTTVRSRCDRLQREWAPEFDLAGYFIQLRSTL